MTAPKVVAEYGQTMKGSIDVAHAQVAAAADAGCWAYKTQLLNPTTIARADAGTYWTHGREVSGQRESFERAGLIDYWEWNAVGHHARARGLEFVATPFDLPAVEYMKRWDCDPIFKVASGDLTNVPLLRAVAAASRPGRPIIVSTGAAYMAEVAFARHQLRFAGVADEDVIWLACTLAYPTPPEDAELARITALRQGLSNTRHRARVGYSDHVALGMTAVAAAALGAELLEVHCTLDPGQVTDCPDDVHGLGPTDLALYVTAAGVGAQLRGSGRVEPVAAEMPARRAATRSICAARDLPAGHLLDADDLICLRPGDGIPAASWDDVVGSVLVQSAQAGEPLRRPIVRPGRA